MATLPILDQNAASPARVAIHGTGLAARCCVKLLADAGIATRREPAPRTPRPPLLMSDAALALLRDCLGQPDLLARHARVTRRIVAWGGREPVALEHGAIMLGAGALDAALGESNRVTAEPRPLDTNRPPFVSSEVETRCAASLDFARDERGRSTQDEIANGSDFFTLHTAAPFPAPQDQRFGARLAHAVPVGLRHADDRDACWVEAVEAGWLFLLPGDDGAGWLLAVGDNSEALLDQSRHVAPRLDVSGPTHAAFETAPRMLAQLSAPGWLACGHGAIAFDPICGDGSAQAVREAILAAAVIAGIHAGGDAPALLSHYQAMLLAAMRRHLRLCADFYASGGTGAWWSAQLAALHDGFAWCTQRLASYPEPAFALHDFRLVARAP